MDDTAPSLQSDQTQREHAQSERSSNLTLPTGCGRRRETGSLRMIRRAFREQWPMTSDERREAIECCLRVVRNPDADTRAQVAAVQALIAADNVNAKRESTDTQADAAEQRLLRDQLRNLLSDPVRAAALLGGNPPQLPPPSDNTTDRNGTTEHPAS